jgi:hypothetical protein
LVRLKQYLLGCGLEQTGTKVQTGGEEHSTVADCKMEDGEWKMENGYNTVFIQTSDGQHRRFEFGREVEADTVT